MRAITVSEPEWLEEDRDWARADVQARAGDCPGCELPLEETTLAENEGKYVADEPLKCHACAALTRKKRAQEDPSDVVFRVRKLA